MTVPRTYTPPRRWRRRPTQASALIPVALLLLACSDGGPSGPEAPDVVARAAGGDGQLAPPGQRLPTPLRVLVQRAGTESAAIGVQVRWEIVAGAGASLAPQFSVTDSAGLATTSLTLGPELGVYRVRVTSERLVGDAPEFEARAVTPPRLTEVPAGPVRAGDTIRVRGEDFSPNPDENILVFSGVRGAVVEGTPTELRVVVPPCLPDRDVGVAVQLGAERSPSLPLSVREGPQVVELAPGQDRLFDDARALSCFRLPSLPGSRYLAVPLSAGSIGGARYDYALTGLTRGGGATAATPAPPGAGAGAARLEAGAQERFEEWLRAREDSLVRFGPPPAAVPPPAGAMAQPAVGDRREFNVLNREGGFDRVTAEAKLVGRHAVLYQDLNAPAGGLTAADFSALSGDFDDPVHPLVTSVFGVPSDLDGNGRIVILFTPVVNRLTPRSSQGGFVGGFFYGLDLLRGRTGSNEAEIFYTLVPDPEGRFSDPRARQDVLQTVPAILAHEFQHMVHFNERVLQRGALNVEALWLSEGLAQMAEDIVSGEFASLGDEDRAFRYQVGNLVRARRFLLDPAAVSLIVTVGTGTLEERGAGWLFLRYLRGHAGGNQLLTDLTRTTRTGITNVTAVTGRPWETLVSEWSGALFLDDAEVPVRGRLRFPDLELRASLDRLQGGFPLAPVSAGGSDFRREGSLWSSSAAYLILEPPASGGLAVDLAAPQGGPIPVEGRAQLLLVRLR